MHNKHMARTVRCWSDAAVDLRIERVGTQRRARNADNMQGKLLCRLRAGIFAKWCGICALSRVWMQKLRKATGTHSQKFSI